MTDTEVTVSMEHPHDELEAPAGIGMPTTTSNPTVKVVYDPAVNLFDSATLECFEMDISLKRRSASDWTLDSGDMIEQMMVPFDNKKKKKSKKKPLDSAGKLLKLKRESQSSIASSDAGDLVDVRISEGNFMDQLEPDHLQQIDESPAESNMSSNSIPDVVSAQDTTGAPNDAQDQTSGGDIILTQVVPNETQDHQPIHNHADVVASKPQTKDVVPGDYLTTVSPTEAAQVSSAIPNTDEPTPVGEGPIADADDDADDKLRQHNFLRTASKSAPTFNVDIDDDELAKPDDRTSNSHYHSLKELNNPPAHLVDIHHLTSDVTNATNTNNTNNNYTQNNNDDDVEKYPTPVDGGNDVVDDVADETPLVRTMSQGEGLRVTSKAFSPIGQLQQQQQAQTQAQSPDDENNDSQQHIPPNHDHNSEGTNVPNKTHPTAAKPSTANQLRKPPAAAAAAAAPRTSTTAASRPSSSQTRAAVSRPTAIASPRGRIPSSSPSTSSSQQPGTLTRTLSASASAAPTTPRSTASPSLTPRSRPAVSSTASPRVSSPTARSQAAGVKRDLSPQPSTSTAPRTSATNVKATTAKAAVAPPPRTSAAAPVSKGLAAVRAQPPIRASAGNSSAPRAAAATASTTPADNGETAVPSSSALSPYPPDVATKSPPAPRISIGKTPAPAVKPAAKSPAAVAAKPLSKPASTTASVPAKTAAAKPVTTAATAASAAQARRTSSLRGPAQK